LLIDFALQHELSERIVCECEILPEFY
jgi:hypothetical protein